MKITGELLKSERTRKNLSIQDVSFALKLSSKIITSIESGETENLPAKTFIRGFVKSYAQFLKIDVEQVMRQFQEEMGSTHPLPKSTPIISPNNSSNETASSRSTTEIQNEYKKTSSNPAPEQPNVLDDQKSGRSLFYIGIAVVLVILIVAINRFVDRYQKEGVLNPQDVSQVQPLNPNQQSIPQNPIPETGAVSVQPPIETVSGDMTTAKPTALQPLQSVTPTTTPTSTPAQASMSGETDDGFEPSSGKPVEIILEAKKDIEILYARGNTKTFSKLKLTAKQVQVIRSTTGLHIKAEDGGAFHMVVNGVDKGLAGAGNKPVRLSF